MLSEQQYSADAKTHILRRTATLVCFLAGCAGVVGFSVGDPIGAIWLGSLSLLSFAVWVWGARLKPEGLAGNLLIAGLYVCLTVLSLFGGGGIAAPAYYTMPALPALAALTMGRRSALLWTGLCVASFVGMYLYGDDVNITRFPVEGFSDLRLIALICTTLFVVFAILVYDGQVMRGAAALHTARTQALQARAEAEAARIEAEAANEAKSAFLATMSHEFRTPLTAIVGTAELLRDALGPNEQDLLSLLQASSQTLNTLIDDILDLARLESRNMRFEKVPVDLQALVTEVGGMLEVDRESTGLALSYAHHGPRYVLGDPLRLRQILINLGGNALKFTKTGVVEVHSESREAPDGRVHISFVVRDTGIGIPASYHDAIFQRFHQVQVSRKRPSKGAGLGLRIVNEIVHVMDGTITLDSAPEQGSTFTVTFELPATQPPSVAPISVGGALGLRVLLAEDEPINQLVITRMLKRFSCIVEVASDGEEAVAAVMREGSQFDLVLMDCRMPTLGGIEATQQLRAQGASLRIVALTANAAVQDRALCLEAGMDDFISKPLTLARLEKVLVWAKSNMTPSTTAPEHPTPSSPVV